MIKEKGGCLRMNQDVDTLRELEESLWRSETRFDPAYMDRILAPDFFEFGRSGRTYTREDILAGPAHEIDARLPLEGFTVHPIASDVFLVTYVSEVAYEEVELGNRSSLWSKTGAGWQLRFHQGTAVQRQVGPSIDRSVGEG
jgi:hypothetical protein